MNTRATPLELLAQYPAADVFENANDNALIKYRQNGNRIRSARDTLKRITPAVARAGVTRIADLSCLVSSIIPVHQSCRPNVHAHHSIGMNSGSQGKGLDPDQSKVSCLMESLEVYCAEPKHMKLVRGSYSFLKHQRSVVNPGAFQTRNDTATPSEREPLMWTEAYCVDPPGTVLIPAELVYMPFFALDFQTRRIFPVNTNGLAAGSSYLEAIVHALYEVIERHYWGCAESGRALAQPIDPYDIERSAMGRFIQNLTDATGIFYAISIPQFRRNLPVVLCRIVEAESGFVGVGCSGTLDLSISRAFSEAWQARVTFSSGARENMSRHRHVARRASDSSSRSSLQLLSVAQYKKRIIDRTFDSLRDEFNCIMNWLHENGFGKVFIANLTRQGIDVPVVKAVVPGLTVLRDLLANRRRPSGYCTAVDVLRQWGVRFPHAKST
jgi:ribosomal protein S12 methylthiotransferase accessory factor